MSIFYIFVIFVFFRNPNDLSNSYYTILKGLQVADITFMVTLTYNALYLHINLPYLNLSVGQYFDYIIVSIKNICGLVSYSLHFSLAVNRFFAIVFFSTYKHVFTVRKAKALVVINYLFGMIAFGPIMIMKLYHFLPYKKSWVLDEIYHDEGLDKTVSSTMATLVILCSTIACFYSYKMRKNVMHKTTSYKMETKLLIQSLFMAVILLVSVVLFYSGIPLIQARLAVFMYSALNPVVILTMDRTVRNLFRRQLGAWFVCIQPKNVIAPVTVFSSRTAF